MEANVLSHTRKRPLSHSRKKQSVIHPSGTLSQQGTVTTAHRWDSLSVRNKSASYDWLTHTSVWLLNSRICTVNSGLVPFTGPMGTGDNLTFIEIQLQWVQGGWRSFLYCHRWNGGRARHQTLKALSPSDSLQRSPVCLPLCQWGDFSARRSQFCGASKHG